MMYLKYILLVMVDLTVSFLNFFLAPVVVLAANDAGFLPAWLSWFQTPGDSLDHDYGDKRFPGMQTGWRRPQRPGLRRDPPSTRAISRRRCWIAT